MEQLKLFPEPYEKTEYTKSNFLIGAKYRSSLLENKIMAISLSRIQNVEEDEKTGILKSVMKASELSRLMNRKSGSFYEQLNQAAKSMTGKSIGMSNPDKQTFDYIAVIIRAHYENGFFTIEYNPHIKNYLVDIKQNFSILNLPIMLSFKSVYSFRLYELLKSKAFYPKGVERNDNIFKISFSLSELKLNMGVVNAELDGVKRVLKNNKNPDYDKAVEISPEKILENWSDFKKKVLEVAKKEINNNTDLEIDYIPLKSGRGAKVYQIDFIVKVKDMKSIDKNKEIENSDLNEISEDEVLDSISDIIDEPIKLKDIRAIAKAANFNIEKVKKAYQIAKESNSDIVNLTGFLIKAITEEYEEPVPIKRGKTKKEDKKNAFCEFEQHDYDFDEIEQALLNNSIIN